MSGASWRLPLHIPVAVFFSLLILGVGATISLYHFRDTRVLLDAANTALFQNLASDARKALIDANLAVRRSFILLAASSLADASSYAERLQFLPELTGLLAADPLIESVMVGYGNGAFFLVRRADVRDALAGDAAANIKAAWVVLDAGPSDDSARTILSRFDAELRFIDAAPHSGARFEPRLSAWYREAAASNTLVVSAPHDFDTHDGRGVTFARRNGSAVFGVNMGFSAISNLLAEKSLTPSTRINLLGKDLRVLATPALTQVPPAGASAGDGVIRQALPANGVTEIANTVLADPDARLWHVSMAPMPGFGNADWVLVVATPEDEIFAEAYRQRQRSILLTIIAVLVSFPLAWALSRLLTTPLHRLASEARILSTLQFRPQPETHSLILEVDQLAGAMAMMRTAIARFLEMGRDLGTAREPGSVLSQVAAGAREVAGAQWSAVKLSIEGEEDEQPHAQEATARALQAESEHDHGPLPDVLGAAAMNADGPACQIMKAPDGACWQVLGIPLRTPDGDMLGTLLLAERKSPICGLARAEVVGFLVALAGTAAVALANQRLLKGRKDLLQGVIRMVAEAIDAKSPYTGQHCRRVPQIARRLAQAAHATAAGPLTSFRLNASDWEALEIASWLHDCGKLTTPEYVIDKATKLETLYNRIHEIRTRFEVLKRDAEVAYWKGRANDEDEPGLRARRDHAWRTLDEEFAFVARCNHGGEDMPAEDVQRLERIAERRWVRTLDDRLGLSKEELARHNGRPAVTLPASEALLRDGPEHIVPRPDNTRFAAGNPWGFTMRAPAQLYNRGERYSLKVRRGTLTEEERFKIKEHIVETIIMLSRLPFPADLAMVPEMAGGHHETMDGRGYPRGLHREDMSVTARIMAIADIFEALTASDRPYKRANTVDEALAIMRVMCARKAIDPDLFNLFLAKGLWREPGLRPPGTASAPRP